MKSRRASNFNQLLRDLPPDVRRQAGAAYRQFKRDPFHPSLQFKIVGKRSPIWSVRVGRNYRALGLREVDSEIIWFWIGTHDEYDKLISRL